MSSLHQNYSPASGVSPIIKAFEEPLSLTCFLCNATILFKDRNDSVYKRHLRFEHGAFYHSDFLLASCFLPPQEINKFTAKFQKIANELGEDQEETEDEFVKADSKRIRLESIEINQERINIVQEETEALADDSYDYSYTDSTFRDEKMILEENLVTEESSFKNLENVENVLERYQGLLNSQEANVVSDQYESEMINSVGNSNGDQYLGCMNAVEDSNVEQ